MFNLKSIRLFALMSLLAPFAMRAAQPAQPAAKAAVDVNVLAAFNLTQFSMLSVGNIRLADVLSTDNVKALAEWEALGVVSGYNYNGVTLLDCAKAFNAEKIIKYLQGDDIAAALDISDLESADSATDLDSADGQSDLEDAKAPKKAKKKFKIAQAVSELLAKNKHDKKDKEGDAGASAAAAKE